VPCLGQAEPEEEALKEVPEVPFSGEEVGGRYLDLHEHFHRFVNAKFGKQLDYVEYLVSFSDVDEIPRQQRLSKPFRCASFSSPCPWPSPCRQTALCSLCILLPEISLTRGVA
jgi:hypothetical protein